MHVKRNVRMAHCVRPQLLPLVRLWTPHLIHPKEDKFWLKWSFLTRLPSQIALSTVRLPTILFCLLLMKKKKKACRSWGPKFDAAARLSFPKIWGWIRAYVAHIVDKQQELWPKLKAAKVAGVAPRRMLKREFVCFERRNWRIRRFK